MLKLWSRGYTVVDCLPTYPIWRLIWWLSRPIPGILSLQNRKVEYYGYFDRRVAWWSKLPPVVVVCRWHIYYLQSLLSLCSFWKFCLRVMIDEMHAIPGLWIEESSNSITHLHTNLYGLVHFTILSTVLKFFSRQGWDHVFGNSLDFGCIETINLFIYFSSVIDSSNNNNGQRRLHHW